MAISIATLNYQRVMSSAFGIQTWQCHNSLGMWFVDEFLPLGPLVNDVFWWQMKGSLIVSSSSSFNIITLFTLTYWRRETSQVCVTLGSSTNECEKNIFAQNSWNCSPHFKFGQPPHVCRWKLHHTIHTMLRPWHEIGHQFASGTLPGMENFAYL
jgi:hypothetical protein